METKNLEQCPGKNKRTNHITTFTKGQLKAALKQQINTTLGKDTVHPQMIKKLPLETLMYLLDLHNRSYEEDIVPGGCNINTTIKGEKRPKRCYEIQIFSPNQYTLQKMPNKRLTWYLERRKKQMRDSLDLENRGAKLDEISKI